MEFEMLNYRHKKFDQRKRGSEEQSQVKTEITQLGYFDEPSTSRQTQYSDHSYFMNNDSSQTFSSASSYSDNKYYETFGGQVSRKRQLSMAAEENDYYQTAKRLKPDDTLSLADSMASTQFTSTHPPRLSSAHVATPPPVDTILDKISVDTLRSICKYHGNMVRKFPKKERTHKDQERRNKNTIACRMSRRVKKLEYIAIEEQYKEFSKQHLEIVEQSMRSAAYLNELMKLTALTETNKNSGHKMLQLKPDGEQDNAEEIICVDDDAGNDVSEAAHKNHKSFSIAYLMSSCRD